MILLPIFSRELKRAARNPALYWLRTGAVVLAVALGIFVLRGIQYWNYGAMAGRQLFQIALWGAFFVCLLSGVLLTASLLCQERREGSLALLFLTRVKGFDILLGKLSAVALLAAQIVLGLFPVIALCLTLGGVSLAEFWRAVEILLVTLFFSLCAGLFISALNKEISRAVLVTFGAVLLSTALVAWIDWRARDAIGLPVGGIVPGLIPAMTSLLDPAFRLPPAAFAWSLWFQLALSFGLLALGGLMLKRLALSDGPALSWTQWFERALRSKTERRRSLRHNPIHWLAQRRRWRWLPTWMIFALLILLWTALLHIFDFSRQARLLAIFGMAPLLHLLLKIAIAAEAVERLGSARAGELELLLVTPLRDSKIMRGHYKGLLRQFAWPVATMVLIDLLFAFCYEPAAGQTMRDSIVGYLFVYTLALTLIIDLPALALRGLWNGLRCRTATEAVRRTVLEVVILPVPAFIASFGLVSVALIVLEEFLNFTGLTGARPWDGWITGLILWWSLVSFLLNTFLQRDARFKLETWLRYLAADPAGARARLARARPPRSRAPTLEDIARLTARA